MHYKITYGKNRVDQSNYGAGYRMCSKVMSIKPRPTLVEQAKQLDKTAVFSTLNSNQFRICQKKKM